jgi:hypothetical protein
METRINEIADGIFRLSTFVPEIAAPAGFTFNQFLVLAQEPLLFHCGHRKLFPDVSAAVARVRASGEACTPAPPPYVAGADRATRHTSAPVVGVSPIIGGAPVRGMADACLTAIGVETSAAAVAGLYADFLDGWLVDERDGERAGERLAADQPGLAVRARPLLMTDLPAAGEIAGAALDLALALGTRSSAR